MTSHKYPEFRVSSCSEMTKLGSKILQFIILDRPNLFWSGPVFISLTPQGSSSKLVTNLVKFDFWFELYVKWVLGEVEVWTRSIPIVFHTMATSCWVATEALQDQHVKFTRFLVICSISPVLNGDLIDDSWAEL